MRALVPVADGIEDIEAVTIIDVLRRAGVDVTVASIGATSEITAARGCRLTADALLADLDGQDYDLIACPGGAKGAEAQGCCEALVDKLREQKAAGRLIGAICAAPALVLAANGLADDRRATCYPSFRERLPHPSDERVVIDGTLITSQSPATAMEFSLALVEALAGTPVRRQVASAMLTN